MNKLLITLAAGLALSGVAAARAPQELPTAVVQYGDLNLETRAGIVRLHARIHGAAEKVCETFDSRVLGLREQYENCISDAVADAVQKVGNPNLSNFHRYGSRRSVFAAN